MFTDRREAGRNLAEALKQYHRTSSIVLAIPRGGVVVAEEVASALDLPLSMIIPRKIGAPENPELAIGATAGEGKITINQKVKESLNVSDDYIKQAAARENEEIKRRNEMYLSGKKTPDLAGKTVIIVDDGIATGSTAEAAIKAVKSQNPKKTVLAVPVAPPETVDRLARVADEITVLMAPVSFYAVGQFYNNFEQTTDEEVIEIMKKY